MSAIFWPLSILDNWLASLETERHIPQQYDTWLGSLPTIAPGDTNTNPIHHFVNSDGQDEYFRER